MAASVALIKQKRQRENYIDDDQNLHKRSRDGILSELFTADDGECDAVEDDLVLQVVKCLEEEINGDSNKGENSGLTDEVAESVVRSYEDLVNATDDQLGICPISANSVDEDDNEGISNEFWSDLFENPSNISTGESVDSLHPFLSHCLSYNNRNYAEYNTLLLSEDQQEWIWESFTDF